MPQPLISLVVPVYRAEAYLPACVQSIRAQRYGALDVVCVDDGSPDRCPELLDRYAREDARIRVIHQPNAGQAAARNAGVAAARGAYLTFVDSDDQIEPDLVGSLLRAMTQAGADAGMTGSRRRPSARTPSRWERRRWTCALWNSSLTRSRPTPCPRCFASAWRSSISSGTA